MSELNYWMWLSEAFPAGSRGPGLVLDYFGSPKGAYLADEAELRQIEGLAIRDAARLMDKGLERPERLIEECQRKGIRIVTYNDAEYPSRLKGIANPPALLYVRGLMIPSSSEVTVAVVGGRKATPYGQLAAKKIGYQIGCCGGSIVSGLAKGIDTKALEGGLSAGAPVAAVLGCGVDVVYPAENRELYEDLAACGSLISEYPPGTRPEGRNFPVRNRIISGLSLGVVVIEASRTSGALITASHALEQGRDVFSVPGNIDVAISEGSNRLIAEGAILVSSGWDVVREYAAQYPGKISLKSSPRQAYEGQGRARAEDGENELKVASSVALPRKNDKKVIDNNAHRAYIDLEGALKGLSGDERAIAESLLKKPLHVDDIIDLTRLPASRVLASLTLLEVEGLVTALPGKRFKLRALSP